MKTLTLLFAFAILTLTASAQKTFPEKTQFSFGADVGYLTGGLQNTHKFILGASGQVAITVAKPLQLIANASFLNFFGKTVYYNDLQDAPSYGVSTSLQMLPIKAGFRYFLEPNFYLQGDAGIALLLNNSDAGFEHTKAFTYSPQMGVLLQAGGENFVDISLRYEATGKFDSSYDASKYNFVGLRVAYGF